LEHDKLMEMRAAVNDLVTAAKGLSEDKAIHILQSYVNYLMWEYVPEDQREKELTMVMSDVQFWLNKQQKEIK